MSSAEPTGEIPSPKNLRHQVRRRWIIILGVLCVSAIAVVIALAIWGSLKKSDTIVLPYNRNFYNQLTLPNTPPERFAHGAVGLGVKMYIHGGYFATGNVVRDDLWVYDGARQTWTSITATGDVPSARLHHDVEVLDSNTLLLTGGFNIFSGGPPWAGQTALDDMYTLDVRNNKWTLVTPAEASPVPPARGAHDGFVYGGEYYMFGGGQHTGAGLYNDMWKFNFQSKMWTNLTTEAGPAARLGFALTNIDDTHVLLFAGTCTSGVGFDNGQCNDLWSYDVGLNNWTLLTPGGTLPKARRATHAVVALYGILYIFGGVYLPPPNMLNDMFAYDPITNKWFDVHPNWDRGPTPPGTFGHSVVQLPNRIIIFGGRVGSAANPGSNQLWEYIPVGPPI